MCGRLRTQHACLTMCTSQHGLRQEEWLKHHFLMVEMTPQMNDQARIDQWARV